MTKRHTTPFVEKAERYHSAENAAMLCPDGFSVVKLDNSRYPCVLRAPSGDYIESIMLYWKHDPRSHALYIERLKNKP